MKDILIRVDLAKNVFQAHGGCCQKNANQSLFTKLRQASGRAQLPTLS
jgi:hypothetical protein